MPGRARRLALLRCPNRRGRPEANVARTALVAISRIDLSWIRLEIALLIGAFILAA